MHPFEFHASINRSIHQSSQYISWSQINRLICQQTTPLINQQISPNDHTLQSTRQSINQSIHCVANRPASTVMTFNWSLINQSTNNSPTFCYCSSQVAAGDTSSTFSISNNDQSAATWSYINGKDATNGIQMTSATGDKCPNGKARTGIAQFVCGKSTGVITAITENPTCTYTLTVPTDMLCTQDSVPFEMDPEYVKKVQHMRPTLRA